MCLQSIETYVTIDYMSTSTRPRVSRASKVKNQKAMTALYYESIYAAQANLAAQFGLSEKDVDEVIMTQLVNIIKKQYQESNPDTDPDIAVVKNQETKMLEFHAIVNDEKIEILFKPERRKSEEFISAVLSDLDSVRAKREFVVFANKKGTLVKGTIEKGELAGYVVDLGQHDKFKARAFLPKNEVSQTGVERSKLTPGSVILAYIFEIKTTDIRVANARRVDDCPPRIILSRTRVEFLEELFKMHCYEVAEGVIEIKKIAREPGVRAKVAVASTRPEIDPIGGCIGVHGCRIKPIIDELTERIDVINWSSSLEQFVKNALSPIVATSCVIKYPNTPYEKMSAEVIVPENREQAIGRQGTNAKLISILTECKIEILPQPSVNAHVIVKLQEEMQENLIKYLDVDQDSAYLLLSNGFTSTFSIMYFGADELVSKLDLPEEDAQLLYTRACESEEVEIADLLARNIEEELIQLLRENNYMHLIYNLLKIEIHTVDEFRAEMRDSDSEIAGLFSLNLCN
jgi:transcription termination factor NusA